MLVSWYQAFVCGFLRGVDFDRVGEVEVIDLILRRDRGPAARAKIARNCRASPHAGHRNTAVKLLQIVAEELLDRRGS
jgi:hypothetical protein